MNDFFFFLRSNDKIIKRNQHLLVKQTGTEVLVEVLVQQSGSGGGTGQTKRYWWRYWSNKEGTNNQRQVDELMDDRHDGGTPVKWQDKLHPFCFWLKHSVTTHFVIFF